MFYNAGHGGGGYSGSNLGGGGGYNGGRDYNKGRLVLINDLDAIGRRVGNDYDVFCHGIGRSPTGSGSSG